MKASDVTREDLGQWVFDEQGMDLEDWHLDALWAMMANSKDKQLMADHFARFILTDDVKEGRCPEDDVFGKGHEIDAPW